MNRSYSVVMGEWIYVLFFQSFYNAHKSPKFVSPFITYLPWSHNRISKPTHLKTKLIKFWPKPGSLLVFSVLLLTSIYSSGHLFSSQGHRVSKWQRWDWNLGCLTPNVPLFASSQAPGHQETWTKLPLQLCKGNPMGNTTSRSPWGRHKRLLPLGNVHSTWPWGWTILLSVWYKFKEVVLPSFSGWQSFHTALTIIRWIHLATGYNGNLQNEKPALYVRIHSSPSACHLKCRTPTESPFGLVIFLNFCQTTA